MSMTGFCVIGDDTAASLAVPTDAEHGRVAWVTAYVWKHVPAGSTLLYVWRDPRAFVVLGSGLPADPHSLKAVFGERDAGTLPNLTLQAVTPHWRSCVARLALQAYGDENALQARVRP